MAIETTGPTIMELAAGINRDDDLTEKLKRVGLRASEVDEVSDLAREKIKKARRLGEKKTLVNRHVTACVMGIDIDRLMNWRLERK